MQFLVNVQEGERKTRTCKEKDKEGDSGHFYRVGLEDEETESGSEESPCHFVKRGQEEVASSKQVNHLPSHI